MRIVIALGAEHVSADLFVMATDVDGVDVVAVDKVLELRGQREARSTPTAELIARSAIQASA